MKNNLFSVVVLVVIVAVLAVFIAYLSSPHSKYSEQTLIGLAKTLAEKKITMYGAEWCPHCKAEKARFGSAWQYVPYVECPANEKLCLDKQVRGYPTWITPDGTKYEGEQGIEKLAQIAGYDLGK